MVNFLILRTAFGRTGLPILIQANIFWSCPKLAKAASWDCGHDRVLQIHHTGRVQPCSLAKQIVRKGVLTCATFLIAVWLQILEGHIDVVLTNIPLCQFQKQRSSQKRFVLNSEPLHLHNLHINCEMWTYPGMRRGRTTSQKRSRLPVTKKHLQCSHNADVVLF